MTEKSSKTRVHGIGHVGKRRHLFRWGILIVSSLLSLFALELVARPLWKVQFRAHMKKQLHGFDHVDRERLVIVLNPGVSKTVSNMFEDLRSEGKTVGLKNLQSLVERFELKPRDCVFEINSHGFKGPEFDVPKPSSVVRILTLGDSCTFGPYYDLLCYPRVLERTLQEERRTGYRVEVVNAGVLGYNLECVLRRIDDFLRVDPDLVTIYLGWNRTIARADPRRDPELYRRFAFYRFFYHGVLARLNRASLGLTEDVSSGTTFEPDDPLLEKLTRHDFRQDMEDLAMLVKRIRVRNPRCQIAVITLAGLYDTEIELEPESLQIAHPVTFTRNLCAWPILTRRYNEELRRFCGDSDVTLIDFELWAREHLRPRTRYFIDSVHLAPEGYQALGEFLSREILHRQLLNRATATRNAPHHAKGFEQKPKT